ncbi:smyd2-b [Scenedesmus sp. PABB004]|nr:smyd2-b [Scenedesmus sp. PABB004]
MRAHRAAPPAARAAPVGCCSRGAAARRRRRPAAAPAGAAGPVTDSGQQQGDPLAAVYVDARAEPPPFLGPVAAVHLPGKGRGLVATSALVPGQLLLVSPPLALVRCEMGNIPDHDALLDAVVSGAARFTPWTAAWLTALAATTDDDGNPAAPPTGGAPARAPAAVPPMLPPPGEPEAGGVGFDELRPGMTLEQLWAAIVLNCYGEGYQDLPATLAAGPDAALSGHLGLWGPFSLLNHACCPNAVAYTLRDAMVVRAAAAVAEGEELCINYLGRGALEPLAQRQANLDASYGFTCTCARCVDEAAAAGAAAPSGASLGELLAGLVDAVPAWDERLAQLLGGGARDGPGADDGESAAGAATQPDRAGLAQLAAELQARWRDVDGAAAAAGGGDAAAAARLRAWTGASAFDLLGLLHEAQAGAGQPAGATLDAVLRVCEQVCPGSDLHVFEAVRRLAAAQAAPGGADDGAPAARAASDALARAVVARYGPALLHGDGALARLVAASVEACHMVRL